MPASTLSLVSVAPPQREARVRELQARVTGRGVNSVRLDLAVRDLTHDGFEAEGVRPFNASELYDASFREDGPWSARLRVRVVDSHWLAVRGTQVSYLTRFQFVHREAAATREVIDSLLMD